MSGIGEGAPGRGPGRGNGRGNGLQGARRAGLALAAILAAAVAAAPAARADDDLPRTISVTGEGEAVAAPDIARIEIGVTTEGATANQALTRNSERMSTVIGAIREAGVAERDVQTSTVSLSPVWTPPQNGRGRGSITGYSATNRVMVTMREFDRLGPLLDAAGRAGATDIGGISFDVSARKALQDEARRAAVADARAKAGLYAGAAGVDLGRVIAITEGGADLPRPMMGARMAMAEAADAVPIEGGELTVRARVSVIFGIE